MWDSFMTGVSTSIMRNLHKENGENEFAEMEYMNITVITSNKPYGTSDGSNSLFDGHVQKFNLKKNGVHSGHVQTGIHDPFCLQDIGRGRCKVTPCHIKYILILEVNYVEYSGKSVWRLITTYCS